MLSKVVTLLVQLAPLCPISLSSRDREQKLQTKIREGLEMAHLPPVIFCWSEAQSLAVLRWRNLPLHGRVAFCGKIIHRIYESNLTKREIDWTHRERERSESWIEPRFLEQDMEKTVAIPNPLYLKDKFSFGLVKIVGYVALGNMQTEIFCNQLMSDVWVWAPQVDLAVNMYLEIWGWMIAHWDKEQFAKVYRPGTENQDSCHGRSTRSLQMQSQGGWVVLETTVL